MTDVPEHDPVIADALRSEEPAPLPFAKAMAAARHRRLVRAVPIGLLALALVVGGGIAAVQQGGGDAAESIVADAPAPTVSETGTPEPTVSSTPVPPSPTAVASAPGVPSTSMPTASRTPEEPSPDATSATSMPARTTEAPPPDLPADQLMTVAVTTDLATAAPGNIVEVTVSIRNISRQTLFLSGFGNCGQGFGSLTAADLRFDSRGDACGLLYGVTLDPGASRSASAILPIMEGETTRRVEIEAEAAFSQTKQADQADISAFDKRVSGATALDLQDAATGTRTFTLVNDTDRDISTYCPCTPVLPSRGITLTPGKRAVVTSSVYGEFTLSATDGSSPRSCLDIASLPRGNAGTVANASSAGACPG